MTEKELKRLSRADLLEMLIDQSKEMLELRKQVETLQEELHKREIAINQAGSIAEASLMLNGVFEAAQAACQEYVENTCKLYGRQEVPTLPPIQPARPVQPAQPVYPAEPVLPAKPVRVTAPREAVQTSAHGQPAEKPNQYAVRANAAPGAAKHPRALRYQALVEAYDPEAN